MKAAIWEKLNLVKLKEVESPKIRNDEVLIKVKYVGICRSDINIIRGEHINATPPLILGHEFSGIIENSKSTDFKKGEKVVVEPLISCKNCKACISGYYHICKNLKLIGIHVNGAIAEYIKVHKDNVFKLPEKVKLKEGALIEPLSVAIHSIDKSNMKFGDNVLIIGAGPIGILCGILSINYGAKKVIILDTLEYRLNIAKKFGMITINASNEKESINLINKLTENEGADIVFECSGLTNIFNYSLDRLAIGGTLVLVGILKNNINADFKPIVYKEQKIIGVRVYKKGDFKRSIDFIAERKVNILALITHIFELNEINEAFSIAEDNKCLKVLVRI